MKLLINNRDFDVDDGDLSRPLLWVLRDELGLTGTKYGCGKGICGSCTIHLDDQAIRSCVVPLSFAEGKEITTIEGLAEKFTPEPDLLHPVQQARGCAAAGVSLGARPGTDGQSRRSTRPPPHHPPT